MLRVRLLLERNQRHPQGITFCDTGNTSLSDALVTFFETARPHVPHQKQRRAEARPCSIWLRS